MNTDTILPKPALIIIRGLPGSGKSYLAHALEQKLGKSEVTILDPDQIDQTSADYVQLSDQLRAEGVEEKFFPNRFLKSQGYAAISAGRVIIWNQAFTDLGGFQRSIGSLVDFAAEREVALPVLVVEVMIDPEVAKARVADRVRDGGHDVSEDAFARFIRDYGSFADAGFATVQVDGQHDVDAAVDMVTTALQRA